jgi:hypothetical protein
MAALDRTSGAAVAVVEFIVSEVRFEANVSWHAPVRQLPAVTPYDRSLPTFTHDKCQATMAVFGLPRGSLGLVRMLQALLDQLTDLLLYAASIGDSLAQSMSHVRALVAPHAQRVPSPGYLRGAAASPGPSCSSITFICLVAPSSARPARAALTGAWDCARVLWAHSREDRPQVPHQLVRRN